MVDVLFIKVYLGMVSSLPTLLINCSLRSFSILHPIWAYLEEMRREGLIVVPIDALITAAASRGWICLDCTGEATVLDVDKSANHLHQKLQIHARDLRILDPLLSYPCAILGREKAILVNLEHIKAIITAEEVFLRDLTNDDDDDDNVTPVVDELKSHLPPAGKQGESTTFEFRALEVALKAICKFLDARTTELESASYPELDELKSKISCHTLDGVCKLEIEMTRLTGCVQKVRDVLKQLLDNGDKMAELYLSRKLASSPSISERAAETFCGDENDVKELKMLLEAYFMEAERTLNRLTTLREDIDVTVKYKFKNHRNQSIQLEHILNSGTFCQTILTQVTGIFGMNIPFTWNHAQYGFMFKWVVIIPVVVSVSVFGLILEYARRKGLVGL
ncbi:magnesium transporter MRS2-I-like [Papaver somniferum]|uniref:magnesium transporter MRS2-I-like n=1 Tax=Papaver somniferum TaxID=3469 RepID=UPI000E6F51A5|nr:magnesium transporter MRS2-I-like [Papaver somniferum]